MASGERVTTRGIRCHRWFISGDGSVSLSVNDEDTRMEMTATLDVDLAYSNIGEKITYLT